MDFQQLMTFCTVVSEGSMTAAAAKLSVTQPAVSQQIRNLETELGTKIVVRGVRHIRLTVQGQLLYNHARKILNLMQNVRTAVQTMSDDLEGEIQIGTLNSIGINLITPIIGAILKPSQQKLHMGLSYGIGSEIIKKMRDKEIDIAILPDLKSEYGLELPYYGSQFLFKDELLFVGSGQASSLPKTMSIKDMGMRPMVGFKNLFPSFRNYFDQLKTENHIGIKPVFESNNVGTLKRMIEAWMCWGFLPSHSIHKQIRMGRLSVIQIEGLSYSMNINAYYRVDLPEKKKIIDTFLMMLQKQNHF